MKSISVQICGHSFQIRSDADAEHVRALADEITERFNAIEKRGPRTEQEFRAMAVLAVVMLDELYQARADLDALRRQARSFAEGLLGRIDDLLGGQQG